MEIAAENIINFRLQAHHLDRYYPHSELLAAAGAAGLQNTPPGVWETALCNRIKDCKQAALQAALYDEKTLLQAWSFRGVPVVFPTDQSDVFLGALTAGDGEEPWIYTRGLGLATKYLRMSAAELLPLVVAATKALDTRVVTGKTALDQLLAALIRPRLPVDKQTLWQAPSMYDTSGRQTVGEAVVSFLLRPCACRKLVVFGRREDGSPTFTSYRNWMGQQPRSEACPEVGQILVHKFMQCYGPATRADFIRWLGCSPAQGKRLWSAATPEMTAVTVDGKTGYILTADRERLREVTGDPGRLLLLGPHDPYLDIGDRTVLLADKVRQRQIWRTTANPGAVLRGGRIIGLWRTKTQAQQVSISIQIWDDCDTRQQRYLRQLAQEYAVFRGLTLKACDVNCSA